MNHPLRLAVGSHSAGSGRGCAMNVISWENGDSTITDFPPCADPFLARVVQRVNDTYCIHKEGDLLCPECSVKVLELAHRTVGTVLNISPSERAKVYVTIALEEAESVCHLTNDERPRAACALVRRFLAGEDVTTAELRTAGFAAYAAAYAAYATGAVTHAADAAAYAAYAAAYATGAVTHAADAARVAAYAADAAYAASPDGPRLSRAHRIIDRFEELTGTRSKEVAQRTVDIAVQKMMEVTR